MGGAQLAARSILHARLAPAFCAPWPSQPTLQWLEILQQHCQPASVPRRSLLFGRAAWRPLLGLMIDDRDLGRFAVSGSR